MKSTDHQPVEIGYVFKRFPIEKYYLNTNTVGSMQNYTSICIIYLMDNVCFIALNVWKRKLLFHKKHTNKNNSNKYVFNVE